MNPEEQKALRKATRRAKRIATEKAGELHDLVEDRLPAAFEELPELAQETYEACKSWAEANQKLLAAETRPNETSAERSVAP